jgi:hypothetical protein
MIELEWEAERQKLEEASEEGLHEKVRKDFSELRKQTQDSINESLTIWRNSGIKSIHEHHSQIGTIGHGDLLAKYLVWCGNDYYLTNWEHLAFQPRAIDLASLINDLAVWEPDWILFFINECSKAQPFWPEEYDALLALLKYPRKAVNLFGAAAEQFEKKDMKEIIKEQARKERCLTKVWKELSARKRWVWSRTPSSDDRGDQGGKISMVLSPVETWGEYLGADDSIIQVNYDQKIPSEIIERLTNPDSDRVLGGRDGNILDATTDNISELEISEEQPVIPREEIETVSEINDPVFSPTLAGINSDAVSQLESSADVVNSPVKIESTLTIHPIQWANFPKPNKVRGKIETR